MIKLIVPHTDDETLQTQVNWLNDPETVRFSEQRHKAHTIETQRAYVESFLYEPNNILREIHHNKQMIGTIVAYVDQYNRVANVGILLAKEFWGNGYGFEAWTLLCDSLFSFGMRRIEASCMADNIGMIKVMQKYGMHQEGRRKSHFMIEGTFSDLVLYGRFQ